MRAMSVVVRAIGPPRSCGLPPLGGAIGPAKSCSQVSGITPAVEEMPSVPRRDTSDAPVDGAYSDTPVCVPMPKPASDGATPPAGPPLEPSEDFDGLNAFHTIP